MNRFVLCFIIPWIICIVIPITIGYGMASIAGYADVVFMGVIALPIIGFPIMSAILWLISKPKSVKQI